MALEGKFYHALVFVTFPECAGVRVCYVAHTGTPARHVNGLEGRHGQIGSRCRHTAGVSEHGLGIVEPELTHPERQPSVSGILHRTVACQRNAAIAQLLEIISSRSGALKRLTVSPAIIGLEGLRLVRRPYVAIGCHRSSKARVAVGIRVGRVVARRRVSDWLAVYHVVSVDEGLGWTVSASTSLNAGRIVVALDKMVACR